MTEKRFQEYYQRGSIVSIHDKENNNELVNILQCVELLNMLHEENQLLRKEYSEMEMKIGILKHDIGERYIENEQLKSEINMLKTTIGRNEAYINRLTHKSEWH